MSRALDLRSIIAEAPKLTATTLQFGLAALLVWAWQLETRVFVRVFALAALGFPLHHLLPLRYRLPFFVVLSAGSIALVLGILNAVWLLGLGCGFIAIAHLPVPFWLRVTLQFIYAGVLGACRVDLLASGIPGAIWPILGSMFMFRLIIYMYDLRTKSAPFSLARGLAYFFMIPNVCFTLLPVVDYRTMVNSHYPDKRDPYEIYQRGAELLLRGVVHLVLYRIVYQYALNDPATVTEAGGAARYLVSTFALYLRISGYFHLIVGILQMYGFDLPETHHLYFLANSFTDFWRRINIFWKDFMQKIFFYPVHFRLSRKIGPMGAMAIATVYAFIWTWFLHAYQWFWIRGEFPLTLQDALFWGGLGVVVLANLLWEIKFPKKRSLKRVKPTLKSQLRRALQTIATFLTIVFIWNIWSSPDIGSVMALYAKLAIMDLGDALWIFGGLSMLGLASVIWGENRRGEGAQLWFQKGVRGDKDTGYWPSVQRVAVGGGILLTLATMPQIASAIPAGTETIKRLASRTLNERDRKTFMRGYYEDLTDVGRFNAELRSLYDKKPANWDTSPAAVETPDKFPGYDYAPNIDAPFKRARLVTNQWGMVDREHPLEKPAGSYRLLLVGASHPAGTGVEPDENFPHLLEVGLNERLAKDGRTIEILNAAVPGYGPAAKLLRAEKFAKKFDADGILYVAIDDYFWATGELSAALQNPESYGIQPGLDLAARAGVDKDTTKAAAEVALVEHLDDLVGIYYGRLAELHAGDLEVFSVIIPNPEQRHQDNPRIERMRGAIRKAGLPLYDASSAYDEVSLKSLWVADWDKHPNAEGHRLVLGVLLPQLVEPVAAAMKKRFAAGPQ